MPYQHIDYIRTVLDDLNLNLDSDTVNEVHNFLHRLVGHLTPHTPDSKYLIYVAVAMVSEQEIVPTLNSEQMRGNGIHIETLFSRLSPDMDIATYISYVENIMHKYRDIDPTLSCKIRKLQLAHRVFIKYQKLIKTLNSQLTLDGATQENHPDILSDLQKLVWVSFILLKHQQTPASGMAEEALNFQQQTLLLGTVILYVYLQISNGPAASQIKSLIAQEFSENIWNINDNVESLALEEKVHSLLTEVISRRSTHFKLNEIFSNSHHCKRLLDDLVKKYDVIAEIKRLSVDPFVDEVKFLKLSKNLPPEHIVFGKQDDGGAWTKRIDFDTMEISSMTVTFQQHKGRTQNIPLFNQTKLQSDQNNTSTSTPQKTDFSRFKPVNIVSPLIKRSIVKTAVSPQPEKKVVHHTPWKERCEEEGWFNKAADHMEGETYMKLEKLFNQVKPDFMQTITDMARSCIRVAYPQMSAVRVLKIVKVFYYCVLYISKTQEPDVAHQRLKNWQLLRALLCLITHLYVHSSSLPCKQFRDCAKAFEISYDKIFGVTASLSQFDNTMPAGIRKEIISVEKKILLVYIWEEGAGYNLIITPEDTLQRSQNLTDLREMYNKLNKNIETRIIDIVDCIGGQDYCEKVRSIVSYVMNSKPKLLEHNYIDQIIVCSLLSVLKLHQRQQAPTLDHIFTKYSSLSLSYNSYRHKAFNLQGTEINLLDFYNDVFQEQIKDPILDSSINQRFLATPIRANILSSGVSLRSEESKNSYQPSISGLLNFNEPSSTGRIQQNMMNRLRMQFGSANRSSPTRSDFNTPLSSVSHQNQQHLMPSASINNQILFQEEEHGFSMMHRPQLQRTFSFGLIPTAPEAGEESPRFMENSNFSFGNIPMSGSGSNTRQQP